jgi:hypothetical protein
MIKKILRILFWATITMLFAAPIDVFHLLIESLHLIFEGIEATLDFVIEIIFETSLETTQIIVFYTIMTGIFYGLYQLWRKLPDLYRCQKEKLFEFFSDEKILIIIYWQTSVINKIKLLCATSGLIYLLFI